jgi:hypothetical protein
VEKLEKTAAGMGAVLLVTVKDRAIFLVALI